MLLTTCKLPRLFGEKNLWFTNIIEGRGERRVAPCFVLIKQDKLTRLSSGNIAYKPVQARFYSFEGHRNVSPSADMSTFSIQLIYFCRGLSKHSSKHNFHGALILVDLVPLHQWLRFFDGSLFDIFVKSHSQQEKVNFANSVPHPSSLETNRDMQWRSIFFERKLCFQKKADPIHQVLSVYSVTYLVL